jgi:hypothetical protein
MRNSLAHLALPLLPLLALAACVPKGETHPGSGGAGGGGASTGTSTDTSSGTGMGGGATGTGGGSATTSTGAGGDMPGAPGWTAVPLLDDATDPNKMVYRAGNDLVTGIHFASLDDGWVTTQGSEQTFGNGGAVFKAKQKQVSKVLFGGNRNGLCLLGTIDFHGIEKTTDGFVALAYACDVIASHDGGATFGIESAEAGEQLGIEDVLVMRRRANDTLIVADTGYVSITPGAPGPASVWTDTWAPEANPPVPNPVPADQCQSGPSSPTPSQHTAAYVSPDGSLIAYGASPSFDAQICVSTDGGKTFFPKVLPVAEDAKDFIPTGVTFASAKVGIAWWATSIYPGLQYIYRTVDAGQTWTAVDLPSDVATKSIELASAFFAPDGTHGWMVGYNHDSSSALLLRTKDGGATWQSVASDLAKKVSATGGGKLFTGFALDASHIWVGGNHGVLMANDAGGD